MNKEIKPIQVTQSFLPPIEKYIEKITSIWDTKWVTNNGAYHNELENKLKDYLSVKETTLFTNGHLALDIALKVLDLKGEVITTAFTFASTTHAIVMNGLKPVFCDINLNDFTIDVDKIEALITENTSAIIPVHVYGYPCNIKEIERIAKKHNLKVLYDAAHVFGVKVDDVGIGSFGDISMFSLHATKVYNSIEGGLLTFNNCDYKSKLNMLKNFGITGPETVEAIGMNAKMNEFQAAMGLLNLEYLDEQINRRKTVSEIYRKELSELDGIFMPQEKEGVKHNYAYFPIIIDEEKFGISRDELHEKLKEYNIFTRKYFYPLVTDFDCYKGRYNDQNLNNARYASQRVLTLPIYGELTEKEANYITQSIVAIKHAVKSKEEVYV